MFPSFTIVNVDEKDEKEEVRTLSNQIKETYVKQYTSWCFGKV